MDHGLSRDTCTVNIFTIYLPIVQEQIIINTTQHTLCRTKYRCDVYHLTYCSQKVAISARPVLNYGLKRTCQDHSMFYTNHSSSPMWAPLITVVSANWYAVVNWKEKFLAQNLDSAVEWKWGWGWLGGRVSGGRSRFDVRTPSLHRANKVPHRQNSWNCISLFSCNFSSTCLTLMQDNFDFLKKLIYSNNNIGLPHSNQDKIPRNLRLF